MTIHATAVVDPGADIHESVEIGPYAVIEANVTLGADSRVAPHTCISGPTTIGCGNDIGSFCTIGSPPQDIHYRGEPTELIIGDNNTIREYVSINRGTANGNYRTVIGNNNLLMAYAHIAHDCVLEDNVILANAATLAGHVQVGRHATLGGLVAVHQFCRVGRHSYVGGLSGINLDIPPYVILTGTRNRMRIAGINKIGLRRTGVDRETLAKLDRAFKIIFRSPNLLLKDALAKTMREIPDCPEVAYLVEFFRKSKRGVVKRTAEE